jgi:hypothetical protein
MGFGATFKGCEINFVPDTFVPLSDRFILLADDSVLRLRKPASPSASPKKLTPIKMALKLTASNGSSSG